jgi:hypothetical protein
MTIINYNPTAFEDNLNQHFIKDINLYNTLMYHNFGKLSCLVDRTQSIQHFLDIDYSYCPIPKDPNFNLDFYTITKNRCIELLSLGKQINVSWSGGLDSTYVLFSLYEYANDKSQIKVYGTYNSIIESGDLFDRFIKNKINYTITPNYSSFTKYSEDNCIYVTGSMSNQLFTPGLSYNKTRDCILEFKAGDISGVQDESNDFLIKNAEEPYINLLTDRCLEFLTSSILNSPKPIHTLQELRWYCLFNYTWNSVSTNSFVGLKKHKIERIYSFFNTNEFQLWSIHNKDPVTKTGDYTDERWQIRETISEYIKDSYFSKNKKKFTSVMSPLRSNWLYLSNDYSTFFYDASKNTK